MLFERDAGKGRSNFAKHGVSFERAREVWDDPLHVIVFDRVEGGEARWHAVGRVGPVLLLVVVHVYLEGDGDERIRIVSARKATPRERRRYEHENL